MVLKASTYLIKQEQKIKILGVFVSSGLNNEATINNIISKVNYRSSILRQIYKYANIKTKTIVSTSLVLSIFRYASPILIDSTKQQIQKLQTLLIKTTRPILGFNSYKLSTNQILAKLNWPSVPHL